MPNKNWQFELEEYIKQGEPEKAEKSEAWQTAIGLQAVDGLKIAPIRENTHIFNAVFTQSLHVFFDYIGIKTAPHICSVLTVPIIAT